MACVCSMNIITHGQPPTLVPLRVLTHGLKTEGGALAAGGTHHHLMQLCAVLVKIKSDRGELV